MDVVHATAIDEGGGDMRARHMMRQWVLTGTIPDAAEETAERPRRSRLGRELTPDQVPSVAIGHGVKVSKADLAMFEQMGGKMERQPSRRRPVQEPQTQVA